MISRQTFQYQLFCYVGWDGVYTPEEMLFDAGEGVTVRFFREVEESGGPAPVSMRRLFATAVTSEERRADRPLTQLLLALERGELPVDHLNDDLRARLAKDDPVTLSSGRLPEGRLLPDFYLPDSYRSLLKEKRDLLTDPIRRVVDLLSLRVGGLPDAHGPHLRLLQLRSGNNEDWTSLPQTSGTGGSRGGGIPVVDHEVIADVQAWLSTVAPRTGGYALFREAWSAVLQHPHASFLTAFAALETAAKEWVATQIPHAGWLVKEMPSPPVHRLVGEMIADVVEARGDDDLAAQLRRFADPIRKHAGMRNHVVHGRRQDMSHGQAKSALKELEEAFWLLQLAAGVEGSDSALEHARGRR